MFTKEEIKQRWFEERAAAIAAGKPAPKAGVSLALLVLSSALMFKTTRDGGDYTTHPIHVAFTNTRSTTKQIVGILHDNLEDSNWTLDDLRDLGFSERVLRGVDGMTKREGEKYFDFIVRCGMSGDDAIDKKIEDLDHNSNNARYPHIVESENAGLKRAVYNIALYYLVDIKRGKVTPGTPISTYMSTVPAYANHPAMANRLLEQYSDHPGRLPEPSLTAQFSPPGP